MPIKYNFTPIRHQNKTVTNLQFLSIGDVNDRQSRMSTNDNDCQH